MAEATSGVRLVVCLTEDDVPGTTLDEPMASVLNTYLLFGYASQVLLRLQLHTDSSSVSRPTTPIHFVPRGSNNDQPECRRVLEFRIGLNIIREFRNIRKRWSIILGIHFHIFQLEIRPSGHPDAPQTWRHVSYIPCFFLGKVHCNTTRWLFSSV